MLTNREIRQPGSGVATSSPEGSASVAAASSVESLPTTQFIWGAGIECSFLPHLGVDQFKWTQHDRFWRQDLAMAKEQLGISYMRYAFPWHVLEPQQGVFDWSYADERMEEFERLGLKVILDVMHFGTPLWLKQAVGDPEFPEALEEYTQAIVERYQESIDIWCPCNEPLVCALFSGDFGFWPPHSRKWRGYMPVLSRVVQAVNRSIRAIRRTMPEAVVLLCDNVESYKTRCESLAVEVRRRNLRRFLVLDLLMGRMDPSHPLLPWLTAYGMSDIDLDWFRGNPQRPDVLGLDYYPHSDWQLDLVGASVRQSRSDNPIGLYGIGNAYYQRYGLPMMLTETSVEGQPINREIWLESTVDDVRRLREEGVPMLGYFWWPMIDQVDWDGALTHRIGKVHQVGLFKLVRQPDGTFARSATSIVRMYCDYVRSGETQIGKLTKVAEPTDTSEDQGPSIGVAIPEQTSAHQTLVELPVPTARKNGNGNGHNRAATLLDADPAPGLAGESPVAAMATPGAADVPASRENSSTDRYGIVVFSHLRWGFVWQRPQQFLSRFARKHTVLFVEEPFFDVRDGDKPYLSTHRVMPNVTVATPHIPPSYNHRPKLPELLRQFAQEAIDSMNDSGQFDHPLLWYYSPMDSAWSLGHFRNRGIVYDSMDELSQFTGAPKALVDNERRLMDYADVVFTGGYELFLKKQKLHQNTHFFGCGVEYEHFANARDENTIIPPDIDFMGRPILGWFGVIDERLDYGLLAEIAGKRPEWSIAMVGPVVKVDPNLLPHAPNLFWLGGRNYEVLPNYCKAFDLCIMPFAINAATEYINPTKVLEYFATGRPVISTPVKDVVRQYSDLVYIAKHQDEFIEAVSNALREPDEQRIERCIAKAKASSWDNTVKAMQTLIAEAIKKEDRKSNRSITPLSDVEIAHTYQPTPGS